MKERPILFSGAMVRALLDGSKTQTRRIFKGSLHDISMWIANTTNNPNVTIRCPYGKPGDRLWVRETFQPLFAEGFDHYTTDWETGKGYACRYIATDGRTEWIDGNDNITDRCKPGIHMPRWASRITLEVTGVRIERLQVVSESDARAEGITEDEIDRTLHMAEAMGQREPRPGAHAYRMLWESINGAGSWAANPWVWVVEFRRL